MARIPQGLRYLTVYNPTLKPSGLAVGDDEDAEEQAHILFYTARERAVSRDQMLRQVGLAKALVSFSSLFNYDASCSNIHSQSRRMVVVCPEPNFFIHACFELAKTPRTTPEKTTEKDKHRWAGKGKEAPGPREASQPAYDYYDGSIDDVALQSHLIMGYEQFKVTHGSLTSILTTLGQEALELQLERFFTVWAWKWDVEDGFEFAAQLAGVPIHPGHNLLQPTIDVFCKCLDHDDTPFVIHSPHYIPSSRCAYTNLPASVPRYFLSLFPAPRPRPPRKSSSVHSAATARAANTWAGPPIGVGLPSTEQGDVTIRASAGAGDIATGTSNFLGVRTMNLGMNMNMDVMDVRKWNWGALTFGKGFGRKDQRADVPQDAVPRGSPLSNRTDKANTLQKGRESVRESTDTPVVDKAALDDAMGIELSQDSTIARPKTESEEAVMNQIVEDAVTNELTAEAAQDQPDTDAHSLAVSENAAEADSYDHPPSISPHDTVPPGSQYDPASTANTGSGVQPPFLGLYASPSTSSAALLAESAPPSVPDSEVSSIAPSTLSSVFQGSPVSSSPAPPPMLMAASIYLANGDNPVEMSRRRVLYLKRGNFICAVVRQNAEDIEEDQKQTLASQMSLLLDELANQMAVEEAKVHVSEKDSPVTAAKILKPKDKHLVVTRGGNITSTTGFTSKAGPLFAAHQRMANDPSILEVFSRGQTPPHWHVAHRGLLNANGSTEEESGVYLETMRKESSLTDVDNELAGILRRYSE